jgi:hypothetical protein
MSYSTFQTIKLAIVDGTGLAKDALHIHIGMGVFLLASYLFRHHPKRWQFALTATISVALLGELWDLYDSLPVITSPKVWRSSLHDLINTCWLPAVLTLLQRKFNFFGSR